MEWREPGSLFKQVLRRFSEPQATVESFRCLRERSYHSQCDLCVRVCPVESIDLRGSVSVLDHCTGCGACVATCPVGAFTIEGSGTLALLRQAAAALKDAPGLYITCERSGRGADLKVPCLQRLDEVLLVGPLCLGANQVAVVPCGECPYPSTERRLERLIDRVRGWAPALRFGPGAVAVLPPDSREGADRRPRESGADRRAFFAWISREGVHFAAGVLEDLAQTFHHEEQRSGPELLPVRHRVLNQLLRSRGVDPGVVAYDPEGPWAALLADPVRCNGCGACVQHCPTGAMVEKTEDLQFTLTFSPDRCINCGLCLDACYPAALTYRQDLSLSAVAEGQGDRLVEKQYRHCARCETRFLPTDRTGDGTVCSTCQSWSGGEILGETGTAAAS